jgi:hypothetical protein
MYLVKVILIIVLVYYLLKSIGRIVLPFLFNKAIEKINQQQGYKQKRNGDVTIHFEDKKNSNKDKNIGEYVDYEEIKD